jgi:hypothetical protein
MTEARTTKAGLEPSPAFVTSAPVVDLGYSSRIATAGSTRTARRAGQ